MGKVEGIGIFDGVCERATNIYECWRNMIHRCYNEKYLKKNPTYIDCVVCDEWKLYSNFKKWFLENYIKDYQLDKDLLGDGKIYSPNTCCFVSKEINTFLTNKQRNNTSGHPGVCFDKFTNSWIVHTTISRKSIHLGRSTDFYQAIDLYKRGRNKHVLNIISKYSHLNKNILEAIKMKGGYFV